mgnify:CR=1 FL=1
MPRKTRRRSPKKGGGEDSPTREDVVEGDEGEEVVGEQMGGKKGKTSKKSKTKAKKGTRKRKKMNEFFKLLIDAKKKNAESFVYKGKTYKRKVGTKKNPKLVVYKKA